MTRLSSPRIVLAAGCAAAVIAAAAGCSAHHGVPSSGGATNIPGPQRAYIPGPQRAHTPSATAAPTTQTRAATHAATTPTRAPTRTTRAPSSSLTRTGVRCVTSARMGHCPFGRYPGITGARTAPYVDQNVWGPISGWRQTLYATSPGNWYVTAKMAAGNTAVVSFPNTGFFYNKALSRFSSIVSSFTVRIPARAGTNAEASYDIWFNKTGAIDEVMIQNDYSPGRGPGCGTWKARSVRFGGTRGVPAHPWDLCVNGSTAYWETANGNMPSGTINVLAMLKWLVRHRQLRAGVQLSAFSYGFEISSTGGVKEKFRVSRFKAAAS